MHGYLQNFPTKIQIYAIVVTLISTKLLLMSWGVLFFVRKYYVCVWLLILRLKFIFS